MSCPTRVTFSIEVDSGDMALCINPKGEIAAIIKKAMELVNLGNESGRCYDSNGNHVGFWHFCEEREEESES